MGKSDLIFLQDTLKKIYTTNEQITKLEGRITNFPNQINKAKQRIKRLTSEVDRVDVDNQEDGALNSFKVDELKEILRESGHPISGKKKELIRRIIQHQEGKVGNILEKKLQQKISDARNDVKLSEKKDKIRNHKANEPFPTGWFIVAFFFIIAGIWLHAYRLDNYHTNNPFDCENGEMIDGEKVLDGKDDCSNGHDEKDPVWSTSDAQDYDMDEPLGGLILASCCLPIFIIMFGYDSVKVAFDEKKVKLENEVKQAKNTVNRAKMNLAEVQMQIEAVESQKRREKERQEDIQKNKRKIDELLEREREAVKEMNRLIQQRTELYENIKHLIPYSEYL